MNFALGFIFLWTICTLILFLQFRKAMLDGFEEEMKIRASIVADRTSIDPLVVPLPQKDENFIVLYSDNYYTDTLFSPPSFIIEQILSQRHIEFEETTDEGTIKIIYTIPSDETDKAISQIFIFILIIFTIGIMISGFVGYWLSGKIIKPVKDIIHSANQIDMLSDIQLLKEPENKDELHQLISSFNRMLVRIKEQTSQQNTFFASASHELRTPLSVMKTRIQVLLQNKDLNTDTRNVYNQQLKEIERMTRMVNDFLLMSELKSGKVRLFKTEFDITELIMELLSQIKSKSNERELRFKVILKPDDASFVLNADKEKLRIILSNLIENSLKYSEYASLIELELYMIENIIFSLKNIIRNDITPDIENIKNQYYHSKPLDGEGSGLGLWISSQLAYVQNYELSLLIKDNLFQAKLIIN